MLLADAIDSILECALEAIDPPVCRSFKNPGENAPYDSCETSPDGGDGQLWIAHLGSQPGWPQQDIEPTTCATAWAEQIEVGIVRCAQSKIRDDGTPPAPDLVTADAEQQEDDRLAIRNAILCCSIVEGRDLIVVGWEPIEPQGGCVGGTWTMFIRDAGCSC